MNTATGGLCLLCAERLAEHKLEFTNELGRAAWGLCSWCAGSRIAQVWQGGKDYAINNRELENTMATKKRKVAAGVRVPRNEDRLVITREELGGMISVALYAAKAAEGSDDEDKIMEVLAGVRHALGRPDEDDLGDAPGLVDEEELVWDDDDEAAVAGGDDEEWDWDD